MSFTNPNRLLEALSFALALVASVTTWADVSVGSFNENASTSMILTPAGGGTLSSSNATTNFSLPPVSLLAHSSIFGHGQSDASVTIASYTGPTTVGGSSPGFGLIASSGAAGSADIPGTVTCSAALTFDITLNQNQPYTLSTSGGFARFYSMPGFNIISAASGTLAPGDYRVELFSPFGVQATSSVSLNISSVPEPASLLSPLTISLTCLRRRRR